MNYIGIDVSKQVLSLYDGRKSFTIKNRKGLKELNTYIGDKASNTAIIFEATGVYSGHLREYCREHGIKVHIVNPKKSSNFSKAVGHRSKTDKEDAKVLYAFKDILDEKDFIVPSDDRAIRKLKAYITTYSFLDKTIVAMSGHIEALRNNVDAPEELLPMMKIERDRLKKLKEEQKKQMKIYVNSREDLKKDYKLLRSIKGVGLLNAIMFLSLFKTYANTNEAEITALLGLDPTKKESGTSVRGKMKISKNGDRRYRKLLYFATMTAIQHNAQIGKFYDRLVNEKHKLKMVAITASMRKLLLMAHAVYHTKKPYDEMVDM